MTLSESTFCSISKVHFLSRCAFHLAPCEGYGRRRTRTWHLAAACMHKLWKTWESIKRMNAPLSLSLPLHLATSIHGRGAEHTCKHCERMGRDRGRWRERITCLAGTGGMLISDEEPRGDVTTYTAGSSTKFARYSCGVTQPTRPMPLPPHPSCNMFVEQLSEERHRHEKREGADKRRQRPRGQDTLPKLLRNRRIWRPIKDGKLQQQQIAASKVGKCQFVVTAAACLLLYHLC